MKLIKRLSEPIKVFDPLNKSFFYKLKTKIFTRLNLSEIKKEFKDFNEYFILVSTQNIYNEVREAIPIRDYTVLLRSVANEEFNRNSFLKKQEKLEWMKENFLFEKTSGWKLVFAHTKEENNEKFAFLIFQFNFLDPEDLKKRIKFIEFKRNYREKLSDFDWKITRFDCAKV